MSSPLNDRDRREFERLVAYVDAEIHASEAPRPMVHIPIPIRITPDVRSAIEAHYANSGWQATLRINEVRRTQGRFPEILSLIREEGDA